MNKFQRSTMRPENAARIREIINQIDAKDLLLQGVVLHFREDQTPPFEPGRRLAVMVSNERFVALNRKVHLMLECTPEPTKFFKKR